MISPLAGGLPRPLDVMKSHQGFVTDQGDLNPQEMERAREAVHLAFSQLPEPSVISNRHYPDALQALRLGQFPTLFFHPQPDDPRLKNLEVTRQAQQEAGIYGEGEEAGKTVFGAVAFVPRGPDGRVQVGVDHPNGILAKGGVSFLFKPSVLPRSTFAPYDFGMKASQHGSLEDLEGVALGRILRDRGVVEDPASGPAFENPEEARPERLHQLLQGPPGEAARAFARELTTYHDWNLHMPGGWSAYPPMIEAEMRSPSLQDVEAIVLEPRGQDFNQTIPQDLKQQILEEAGRRGIPVVDHSDRVYPQG